MFLGKIGIDIKLILAQILNFVLLLIILNRILYRPVLKNLKERTEKIKQLEEKEKLLQKREEELIKRKEEIIQKTKERARKILEEAKKISQEEREKMLEKTEREIRTLMEETGKKIQDRLKKIKKEEEREAALLAKKAILKILKEDITYQIHQKYFENTLEELEKLDLTKIQPKEKLKIISAFPLKERERKRLIDLISKKVKLPGKIEEKVDSSLIGGIQILIDGYLIDISIKRKIEETVQNL